MHGCFACSFATLLTPPIALWVWQQQRRVLRDGRPLAQAEAARARAVGVKDAESIRLLALETIPMPGPSWAHRVAQGLSFPALSAAGMSVGRGIYIQRQFEHQEVILIHECVHAAQYERYGIVGFIWRYLVQCLRYGYISAPFEREAVDLSKAACRD